jgi:hypothetical protein
VADVWLGFKMFIKVRMFSFLSEDPRVDPKDYSFYPTTSQPDRPHLTPIVVTYGLACSAWLTLLDTFPAMWFLCLPARVTRIWLCVMQLPKARSCTSFSAERGSSSRRVM